MLHLVNKSFSQGNCLESCLRLANSGDVILLIEDGVYAAKANAESSDIMLEAIALYRIYALENDILARGLDKHILKGIDLINYIDFVELVIQHHPVQSWY